jgi:hypothetical protein
MAARLLPKWFWISGSATLRLPKLLKNKKAPQQTTASCFHSCWVLSWEASLMLGVCFAFSFLSFDFAQDMLFTFNFPFHMICCVTNLQTKEHSWRKKRNANE